MSYLENGAIWRVSRPVIAGKQRSQPSPHFRRAFRVPVDPKNSILCCRQNWLELTILTKKLSMDLCISSFWWHSACQQDRQTAWWLSVGLGCFWGHFSWTELSLLASQRLSWSLGRRVLAYAISDRISAEPNAHCWHLSWMTSQRNTCSLVV